MSMQDACSPWPCASDRWLLHHSIDRGTQSFISSICSAVADLMRLRRTTVDHKSSTSVTRLVRVHPLAVAYRSETRLNRGRPLYKQNIPFVANNS